MKKILIKLFLSALPVYFSGLLAQQDETINVGWEYPEKTGKTVLNVSSVAGFGQYFFTERTEDNNTIIELYTNINNKPSITKEHKSSELVSYLFTRTGEDLVYFSSFYDGRTQIEKYDEEMDRRRNETLEYFQGPVFDPLLIPLDDERIGLLAVENIDNEYRLQFLILDRRLKIEDSFSIYSRLEGSSLNFFPTAVLFENTIYCVVSEKPSSSESATETDEELRLIAFDLAEKTIQMNKRISDNDQRDIKPVLIPRDDFLQLVWFKDKQGLFQANSSLLNMQNGNLINENYLFPKSTSVHHLLQAQNGSYSFMESAAEGSLIYLFFSENEGDYQKLNLEYDIISFAVTKSGKDDRQILFVDEKQKLWKISADKFVKKPNFTYLPETEQWFKSDKKRIVWEIPEDSSGISGFGFSINQPLSKSEFIENINGFTTSLSLEGRLNPGSNFFQMTSMDRAGNVSEIADFHFLYDPNAPYISRIFSPTHPEWLPSPEKSILLNIQADDILQSVSYFGVNINQNPENAGDDFDLYTNNGSFIKIPLNRTGTNIAWVRALDPTGNASRPVPYYSIYQKTTNFQNLVDTITESVTISESDSKSQKSSKSLFTLLAEKQKMEDLKQEYYYLLSLPEEVMGLREKSQKLDQLLRQFFYHNQELALTEIITNPFLPIQNYYLGVSYFRLSQQTRFTIPQRLNYVLYSQRAFDKVSRSSADRELIAKSMLYAGLAQQLAYGDEENKLKAMDYYERIMLSDLSESKVFNDALLYSYLLNWSVKKTKKAMEYRYLLKTGQFADDEVYDYRIKRVIKQTDIQYEK